MHKELQRIRHGYYDLWFGTNAVYERWAKSHGLNNDLLLTLYLLKEFPNDCTQHLICEKLMLPKQTVNSILSGLEYSYKLLFISSTSSSKHCLYP